MWNFRCMKSQTLNLIRFSDKISMQMLYMFIVPKYFHNWSLLSWQSSNFCFKIQGYHLGEILCHCLKVKGSTNLDKEKNNYIFNMLRTCMAFCFSTSYLLKLLTLFHTVTFWHKLCFSSLVIHKNIILWDLQVLINTH